MNQVEFETDQPQVPHSLSANALRPAPASDPRKRRIQIVIIVVAAAIGATAFVYGMMSRPPAPSTRTYEYQQPPKPIGF